jgi:acyl-CoA thioesterase FadM
MIVGTPAESLKEGDIIQVCMRVTWCQELSGDRMILEFAIGDTEGEMVVAKDQMFTMIERDL